MKQAEAGWSRLKQAGIQDLNFFTGSSPGRQWPWGMLPNRKSLKLGIYWLGRSL